MSVIALKSLFPGFVTQGGLIAKSSGGGGGGGAILIAHI